LGVQEIDAKGLKAAAWDYFTTTVLRFRRSSEKILNRDAFREGVDSAAHCLIALGDLEAYELATGRSAVAQMIGLLTQINL
jgi:hypothetical protein